MTAIAFVVLAGVGGVVRFIASVELNGRWPVGTFMVNSVGAFAIGALHELTGGSATAVLVGGLGSVTSVSAVANECAAMIDANHRGAALGYAIATLVAGVAACTAGLGVS